MSKHPHVRRVGLKKTGRFGALILILVELQEGKDDEWKDDIRTVRHAAFLSLLKHLIDDLAKVEHHIDLALRCLERVDLGELEHCLLYALLVDPVLSNLEMARRHKVTEPLDVVRNLLVLSELFLVDLLLLLGHLELLDF